jgi:hypothetical protein
MKRFWSLLRLTLLAPAIILMGNMSEAEAAAAKAKAEAEAAAKKAAEDEAAKKAAEELAKKTTVTMTQTEFDQTIQKRLAREGPKAIEEYFKGLGMTKEQIESMVKANKEAEEKNKTELQKANEKAAAAEKERDAAKQTANTKLAKAAFLVQAVAAGIPADRIADAAELVRNQLSALTPDEKTGEFDEKEIKKIADELVKAKPYLKAEGGSNLGGGSNSGGGNDKPGGIGEKYAKANVSAAVKDDPWEAKRLK